MVILKLPPHDKNVIKTDVVYIDYISLKKMIVYFTNSWGNNNLKQDKTKQNKKTIIIIIRIRIIIIFKNKNNWLIEHRKKQKAK